MKRSLAFAVGTAVLLAAGSPWAQDSKVPMPSTTAAAPSSGASMDMSSQMDEHTQMMKALHEKMMSAATPEARQIVVERQWEEMQESLATMNQMGQGRGTTGQGGGMMGNMGGGMMEQKGAPPEANAQMQMMQKRMDMMEMMMQTMMDRQGMMSGTQSADATPKK